VKESKKGHLSVKNDHSTKHQKWANRNTLNICIRALGNANLIKVSLKSLEKCKKSGAQKKSFMSSTLPANIHLSYNQNLSFSKPG
jgi:hypothetical protein